MASVGRVVRPGGHFVVYDVMRTGADHPAFPLPWAETAAASALDTPAAYRAAGAAAGLELVHEEDRREAALGFFERIRAQAEKSGPPRIGLHTLLGPSVREKTSNMLAALQHRMIAPILMDFRIPLNRGVV
jgi:hypothetical protein